MSLGYAPKIYLRGGMPYTHIWWPRPPTFFSNTFIFSHLSFSLYHTQYFLFRISILSGVFIMFCVSPGSHNGCSMVFLMIQSARKSRKSKQAKMDEDRENWAFLGVGRPLTRPRPAPRPAGSGAPPASRPALAGTQAGLLGCYPGLPPGLGRFPGRSARVPGRPHARPRPVPRPARLGT